jgi:hypothetical protein
MSTPLLTSNFSQLSISLVFMSLPPLCEIHQSKTKRKSHVISNLQLLAKLTGGIPSIALHFKAPSVTHYLFASASLTLFRFICYGAQKCPSHLNCLPFLCVPTARRP